MVKVWVNILEEIHNAGEIETADLAKKLSKRPQEINKMAGYLISRGLIKKRRSFKTVPNSNLKIRVNNWFISPPAQQKVINKIKQAHAEEGEDYEPTSNTNGQ